MGIGLGRMGGNMVQRLLLGRHRVVTYDRSNEAVAAREAQGTVAAMLVMVILRLQEGSCYGQAAQSDAAADRPPGTGRRWRV
ncbi:MAG: NAD(P)-binding domain-containing protein [Candidatus Methylomirabilia bacterium]